MLTEHLTVQGFASYSELKEAGIRKVFELGKNEWGFNERVIIDNALNQWDYQPEDQIYELREGSAQAQYINNL